MDKMRLYIIFTLLSLYLLSSVGVFAGEPVRFLHKITLEGRPAYIFPTNSYLNGVYNGGKSINNAFSGHLKYSFQSLPGSLTDRIYGGVYQGIGVARYTFGEREAIGNPVALYLFQGGRIVRPNSRLSLNYEWNFGLSFGWKPYDRYDNPDNVMIGTKTNAYLNLSVYLNWMLSSRVDLLVGVSATHFSNGNTGFPNAGMNTAGAKVGLAYYLNRPNRPPVPLYSGPIPPFRRHISYDLVLFGSWKRKGVESGSEQIPVPHKYTVLGFNFMPMYNVGYKFRAGVSLDGLYDASANVYTNGDHTMNGELMVHTPPLRYQMALGVSGRAEYVMPYFTIGVGLGTNVMYNGRDNKGLYQVVALKIDVARSSFLHIGYSLMDFRTPNHLMLGVGYRFNDKVKR